MKPAPLFSVLALFATSVNAECPGGCSGNGVCGRFDMCTCFKNYMGNDCSLKICPFGNAHVQTPKGDLNMDRVVTNKEFPGSPNFILEKSQMYPAGTYEWNHPNAEAEESHFYMECSNEGLCDRATGLCQCFEGFEGSACQRATCNNACSEHGVCKSMREIAAQADRSKSLTGNPVDAVSTEYNLWDADINHGCVCDPWFTGADCSRRTCKVGVDPLFTTYGYPVYESFFLTVATDPQNAGNTLHASSYFRLRVFDYYGESYITDRIQIFDSDTDKNAGTYVQNALLALPNGIFSDVQCIENTDEVVPVPLNDEKGFFVQCIYIDNPGQQRLPEIFDYVLKDGAGNIGTNRVFVTASNRRGEDVDYAATATQLTFKNKGDGIGIEINKPSSITSAISSIIPDLSIVKIRDRHLLVTGSATTTPTVQTSGPADVTITTWAVDSSTITVSATPLISGDTGLVVGDTIVYNSAYFKVLAIAGSGATTTLTVDRSHGGISAVSSGTLLVKFTNKITVAYKYIESHSALTEAPSIAVGDELFAATGYTVAAVKTFAAADVKITTWTVGLNTITISAAPATLGANGLAVGDMIFYQNAYFYIRNIDDTTLTVDRKFGGKSANGASVTLGTDVLYKVTVNAAGASYQYVSPCAGRGLCNDETGVCSCFKGYTNDNCNSQNILAF